MDKNLDQVKGKLKQAAGDLAGDDELRREGKVDERAGNAKERLDKAKDKLTDVIDDVKEKLHGK
jgi:uncharacterized protein YjbJ (UPF0337 family)